MLELKDPLVRVEYNKAIEALKKENEVTDSQKDTYAKMFNPEKRKEEKQKRVETKKKDEVDESNNENPNSLMRYIVPAIFTAGVIGLILYKTAKK
jgi:hypothetical protein